MTTPRNEKLANQYLLFDPAIISEIHPRFFEPTAFREKGEFPKPAGGRGSAFFLSDGRRNYLLRHYMRGGMIARLIQDHYLWLGLERTRAWREWYLLSEMHQQGLPVPRPVAARVTQKGWRYTADLLTLVLEDCRSLAEILKKRVPANTIIEAVGRSIRRFHDAQIDHADLNAHNILINQQGKVYLIDFDQGRRRANAENWKKRNLNRLHRSLSKLVKESHGIPFDPEKWNCLLRAYEGFT